MEVRISVRGKKKRDIDAMLIFRRIIMSRFSLNFEVHFNKYSRKERRWKIAIQGKGKHLFYLFGCVFN